MNLENISRIVGYLIQYYGEAIDIFRAETMLGIRLAVDEFREVIDIMHIFDEMCNYPKVRIVQ